MARRDVAEWLHLVRVELDAGAKRRLEEVRIGRGDAVPAQRVQEGAEAARRVEALGGELGPAGLLQDAAVDLAVPEDLDLLALGVVLGAGEADDRGLARLLAGLDFLDQPAAAADVDQLADFGVVFGEF